MGHWCLAVGACSLSAHTCLNDFFFYSLFIFAGQAVGAKYPSSAALSFWPKLQLQLFISSLPT